MQVELTASLRPLQRWTGDHLELPSTEVLVRAAFDAADTAGPTGRVRIA
jgi:hypothetical protein